MMINQCMYYALYYLGPPDPSEEMLKGSIMLLYKKWQSY